MKKLIIIFLLMLAFPTTIFSQTYMVGTTGGDFATLQQAFDYINQGNVSGDIVLQIVDNTAETGGTAVLYSSYGGINYTSVTIYPTVTALSISGNIAGPLIDLNGADHVIIDGRLHDTGGNVLSDNRDLTITNTNTGSSASTIRFIESAFTNSVQYCFIEGAETNSSGGVIFFSTASTGSGNDGNTIDNNDITNDPAGRPLNAIYSSGTTGAENSGNTISNNDIHDFLNNGTASNGIYIYSNNMAWTISGNSFYEYASFVPSASVTYDIIKIDNAAGTGYSISGNYIGGSSPNCGSGGGVTSWTKTSAADNPFYAIYLNVGTGTASNVQNNTIQNFTWANSGAAAWTGINIAGGDVNVGTVTGNTIGATTGTGSITMTGGATNSNVYGINIASGGTVDCEKNNIGSITAANSTTTNATNFYGIYKTATAGTTTISNNNIGSTATANSLNASSICGPTGVNTQIVCGIYNAGTGAITINSNTLAYITNSTTNTTATVSGRITGIASVAGANTISLNSVHDLTIANANTSTTQNASVCGIALTGTTALKTFTGNAIYNLSNTYSSYAGSVVGLYFSGNTGANIVSGNFIHDLSVTGASSTTASVYGIKMLSGATSYYNNIISLGGTTKTTIYGIYETGTATNNNNLYFNTVYIGGTLGSGATNKSYALYSAVTTNVRDFRNNIFVNARSTTGGSSLHYAAWFNYAVNTNITLDYNDYWVSGTGGVLGRYNSLDVTTLPLISSKDANSLNLNPGFASPGSTIATDYKINTPFIGVTGTGITTDYEGTTRNNPTIGAFELPINKWTGTTSTVFNITGNWTVNVPVGTDFNLIFDTSPAHDCYLDADHSITNITNGQSAHPLVTNGHKLTVKGSLIFTGGAQIDASSASSTVEFAGTSAQAIPSGAFVNNKINNLTVNNTNNVTFSGTLNLLNTLVTTTGLLDATTNSPTIIFGGTSSQTIDGTKFLNGKAYNLTIDNASGVTITTDFNVDNTLALSSGILTLATTKTLTLKGNLTTAGGSIDASAASSTVAFAGGAAQAIPTSAFNNDKVYNLTVNNSNNITFNGTLNLLNTLTTTSGLLNASTNNPTLTLGGSTAQTLDASHFVNGKSYNLTIDNGAGVTLNSDFTVDNTLLINSGKILTISAGKQLIVTGTLTNNAGNSGLVIKSIANGNDGKLINNTASVPATVELYLSGGLVSPGVGRFHYIVPPISTMTIGNSIATVQADLNVTNFNGDLLLYDETKATTTKEKGWQYFDGYGSTTPFTTIGYNQGYNIYLTNDDKVTFTGQMKGTAQTYNLSYTGANPSPGWNLVGNPYPCNYNIAGISALVTNGDNVDNTAYFNNNGTYAYWNVDLNAGTTGYSSIIAPMQGFFVVCRGTGTSLSLPVSSKTANTAAPLRSKGETLVKKVKLVLNNGPVPDETIVCLVNNATSGFDGDFDAYKLFGTGTTTPYIYSEMNSVQYAINSIPDPGSTTVTVPITVVLKAAGTYTIDATEFDNLDGYNVSLTHGSDMTVLNKGASYSFTSGAGTFTDFKLVFGNGTTGVENVTTAKLKTWYSNHFFNISCPDGMASDNANLVIYDIQGRPVLNNNPISLMPGQTIQLPLDLPTGVYITHILFNNQTFVSKIVVF